MVIICKNQKEMMTMKKILFIVLISAGLLQAQFKDELDKPVDTKGGITNYTPSNFLLGFINPQNFQMNHSVSMSYTSFGNQGVALGVYTNNMSYQFSDNLNIEADVSFVNSPYSSFGDEHAKQLNGIYLSRAQLNYRPSDNTFITLQYNHLPTGYGYGRLSPFNSYRYSPFYSSPFHRD